MIMTYPSVKFPPRPTIPAPDRPFDASQLEADIRDRRGEQPQNFAPPKVRAAMEADVGKLTSEAVLTSYDAGAKALEALGVELREMLKRNDEMVADANSTLKQIEETIAECREQGKMFALRVTNSADMIKEVRETCEDLRRKIVKPE
jgi:hypothetical protein